MSRYKKKERPYYGIVTCPVYHETYELDNELAICPCCGDVHDPECYDFYVEVKPGIEISVL